VRRLPALLASVAALAWAAACAHVENPPGGPEDRDPPKLVSTRPDTFAQLHSYLGPVIFEFDEGLSEKGIDTVVTVSPRTSGVAVDKSGHTVRVSLRRGWENNRVYRVTLHPGVQDLFNNATKEPYSVVFSTGPQIVHTFATGRVIERTTLHPATGAVVEAMAPPDTTPYVTRPDSAGVWTLEYLPEGTYLVRAYNDTNKDQHLQPYEARDTTTIRVTRRDTARARRLSLVTPDTTAPKAGTASGQDSTVEVRFDDFLDPAQTVATSQVTITGPGGPVRVVAARVGEFPAARADTGAAAGADTGRAARRDTTPQEPVPSHSVFIHTATALAPDAQYTVTVTGVRNLVGLVGGGQAVPFKTPKAGAPPAAPAPAPRDTSGARPRGGTPPPAARPQTSPAPRPAPPASPTAPRPYASPRPVPYPAGARPR
jgi:hypothetical protein